MTKYEVKIKNLLMQLGDCLSDYSSILLDMLQTKNEKKELDKVVVEVLKILDALDKSFYVNVPFENVGSLSYQIGYIASCAKDARRRFIIAKEEKLVTEEDIAKNMIMSQNLTKLANKIYEYNNNFELKLFTFDEAA